MHRDVITHVVVSKTDFIVTASIDGHVKFWKKMEEGIEFVKHFRSHLCKPFNLLQSITLCVKRIFIEFRFAGTINALSVNANGTYLCTASSDKNVKIFDVINFDMINMIKLDFVPQCAEWIHIPNDAISALAVTDADSPKIAIYDAQGVSTPLHVLEKLHTKPVSVIKYNVRFEVVVSVDRAGMLEYWTGPKNDYKFPSKIVSFESKLDTSRICTRYAMYFLCANEIVSRFRSV